MKGIGMLERKQYKYLMNSKCTTSNELAHSNEINAGLYFEIFLHLLLTYIGLCV